VKAPNLADVYRLSPLQEGILFHTRYAPRSRAYFEQFVGILDGDLEVPDLARAWQQVVDRHPVPGETRAGGPPAGGVALGHA
jgi:hypothetical protein